MNREKLKELIRQEIREAFMPIDLHRVSGRIAHNAGQTISKTVPDKEKFILQDKTTGSFYGGDDLRTPTLVKKGNATVMTGKQLNDLKHPWEHSWTEIKVGEVDELKELSFTGEILNKVRQDIFNFISAEHKKLKYPNPLDTYHLVQQVLDSGKMMSKVKGIR